MILCVTDCVDMVSPAVAGHQLRTAYIAARLAAELGLSRNSQDELIVAGALHDVGALSLKEKLAVMTFDRTDLHAHAEVGWRLMGKFAPFARAASFVRFHHTFWRDASRATNSDEAVPLEASILHLADRVDVLLNRRKEVLGQAKSICEKIREQSGEMFAPDHVAALMKLAEKESFWLDAVSPWLHRLIVQGAGFADIQPSQENLLGLADMFRQMIDFRSRFTATHSSGVAAAAETLAGHLNFSSEDCRAMRIAGFLHDLGKLSIPSEILEKKAALTAEETNQMRHHTYYGFRALQRVRYLDTINAWGSFHHERLDGKGYPFHLTAAQLPMGSRIMAVADIFGALTEDRPYRPAMGVERAGRVLERMAEGPALDATIIDTLKQHAEAIGDARSAAQVASLREYDMFWQQSRHTKGGQARHTEGGQAPPGGVIP